jgi:hypothetical protein
MSNEYQQHAQVDEDYPQVETVDFVDDQLEPETLHEVEEPVLVDDSRE